MMHVSALVRMTDGAGMDPVIVTLVILRHVHVSAVYRGRSRGCYQFGMSAVMTRFAVEYVVHCIVRSIL